MLMPRPVSSKLFTLTRDDDATVLVAELSDLGGPLERVWNDSCDVGLTVISERTGKPLVFCVEREQRDGEGELQYIDLRPASLTERRRFPSMVVRLFND